MIPNLGLWCWKGHGASLELGGERPEGPGNGGQGWKIRRFAVVWLRGTFSSSLQIHHRLLECSLCSPELSGIGPREAGIEEEGGGWFSPRLENPQEEAGPAQRSLHRSGTGWNLLQNPSKGIPILLSSDPPVLGSGGAGSCCLVGSQDSNWTGIPNLGTTGFKCPFWGFLTCWTKPSSSRKPRGWEQFLEQPSFPLFPRASPNGNFSFPKSGIEQF